MNTRPEALGQPVDGALQQLPGVQHFIVVVRHRRLPCHRRFAIRNPLLRRLLDRHRVRARSATDHQRLVERDACEPGSELAGGLILSEVRKGAEVGLLHGVFRGTVFPQDAAGHAEEPAGCSGA